MSFAIIIIINLASALEASTSVPRNSTSFWDLALTAESSAAQVSHAGFNLYRVLLVCVWGGGGN